MIPSKILVVTTELKFHGITLGPTYNEHPAMMSRFLCMKIIN